MEDRRPKTEVKRPRIATGGSKSTLGGTNPDFDLEFVRILALSGNIVIIPKKLT